MTTNHRFEIQVWLKLMFEFILGDNYIQIETTLCLFNTINQIMTKFLLSSKARRIIKRIRESAEQLTKIIHHKDVRETTRLGKPID